jgi:integrase
VKELYLEYVRSKQGVWSETSSHTEGYRLNRVFHLLDGNAQTLWDGLQDYGAYSRTTLWTRVSAFWDWAIKNGHTPAPNPYAEFRKANIRRFRNCYERKPCNEPFEEMLAKIERVPNEAVRNKLKQLLIGGLRIRESDTLQDGHVIGKGGKRRKVYVPEIDGPMTTIRQYSAVLRACKRHLGVTPHKLRSCRMSDMADRGANLFELMKFAGWSNPGTAQSYIEARDEKIAKLAEMRKVETLMGKLKSWARARVTV